MIYSFEGGKMKKVDVPENHKKNNLSIGTILKMNGYNDSEYVIVKNLGISEKFSFYGTKYLAVKLDDYSQFYKEAYLLKHISEKKDDRIQTYYTDKVLSPDEVLEIWEKSEEKRKRMDQARKKKEEEMQELERKGRELFKKYIPENAKALIVAKFEIDKSDSMTDYFATETKGMVVLGYSLHTRDLFSEMRKFADRIPETTHLATPPKVDPNGQEKTEANKDWWHPKDEHREKYAFGAGYYLKEGSRYSIGWKIEKITKWRGDWDKEVYISLAKRCIFKDLKNQKEPKENLQKNCKFTSYKGHPVIVLPNGFSFGLNKARAIIENIEDIKKFVKENIK